MPLEPEVLAHLESGDPAVLAETDPARQRALLSQDIDRVFRRFGEPGPEVERVVDHEIPVTGGTIVLRSYHPVGSAGRLLPGHVLVHGGGWVFGSVDELVCDATARHRAAAADCVVVAVDYRLAPEHPFPTPLHDVVAALRWVRDHASALEVDPGFVTAGGASAGANLILGAVLAAPDVDLRALLLEVVAVDLRVGATAVPGDIAPDLAEMLAPTLDQYEPVVAAYLPDRGLSLSPLVSPVLAEDPSVFPETHLLLAELDVLRPAAEVFARRLAAAGVPVHVECYPGALHGSAILTRSWATARRWHDDTLAVLRGLHSPSEAAHG